MWSNLPFDVLANIFSFLSPDSLARAKSACRHWHTCAKAYPILATPSDGQRNPSWFIALPTRNHKLKCYAHNPITDNWHGISIDFVPDPVRPIAPIGGLLLLRPTSGISLQLSICNIFTRQYKHLPVLNITRTNPAVGSMILGPSPHGPFPYFKVYVAGGMSNAPCGGATYESTLEMYDSRHDKWQIIGSMPMEFAVRLTVWTPNESVYSDDGVLYWMTSARAYSVMGLEIGPNTWKELSVPLADRLEFAALVCRNGKPTLVGGTTGQGACIWELNETDDWVLVENVPIELGMRFLGGLVSWGSTKCVGGDGVVCLYRDLWSGMVVWREMELGKWEWNWVEGCCFIRGEKVQNLAIKGLFLHPNLALNVW